MTRMPTPPVTTPARVWRGAYSNLLRLPPDARKRILHGIEKIARDEFDDRVVRKMLTPVYTARRR